MIISPHTFELSLYIGKATFDRLLTRAYDEAEYSHQIYYDKKKSTKYCAVYIDDALKSDGITIEYHKHVSVPSIRLIVNPSKVLGGDDIPELWKPTVENIKTLIRELKANIKYYFDSEYKLNDFKLSRVDLTANIDVGSHKNVENYIKVLHRMGKVKGYELKHKKTNKKIIKSRSFDLVNKSAGIEFSAYDKEKQSGDIRAKGILRVEIRFKGSCSDFGEGTTTELIKAFFKISKKVFMYRFQLIVPRGDYYKKEKAIELIKENIKSTVPDKRSRDIMLERMINLLELIPIKKSLHLAQKERDYRDIKPVMETFAEIGVSPITISKSADFKYLDSLYRYLDD